MKMIYVASICSFILGAICGIILICCCIIGKKEEDENDENSEM